MSTHLLNDTNVANLPRTLKQLSVTVHLFVPVTISSTICIGASSVDSTEATGG